MQRAMRKTIIPIANSLKIRKVDITVYKINKPLLFFFYFLRVQKVKQKRHSCRKLLRALKKIRTSKKVVPTHSCRETQAPFLIFKFFSFTTCARRRQELPTLQNQCKILDFN